jgi:hypothetical protein
VRAKLVRMFPVVAVAVAAVAMMAGQVAAASQVRRGGEGTEGGLGVSRPAASRPGLQSRPGAQMTSGLKSINFAGYTATPSTLVSAKATIKIPSITCASSGDTGIAPGVWLAGLGQPPFSGAIGLLYCENGQVTYDAAIIINGTQTVPFAVKPGDTLVVSISATTTETSATVRDVTAGLSKTVSGTGGNKTQAFVGDGGVSFSGVGGPVAGVPRFKSYPVSSVSVGGQALGSVHPVSVERVNGKIVQLLPTTITGGNAFKVVFKHT